MTQHRIRRGSFVFQVRPARAGWRLAVLAAVSLMSLLGACGAPGPATAPAAAPVPAAVPAPPPAPVPPPTLPFDAAVLRAATALLADAQPAEARELVIDPLVDGVTGLQSNATQTLGAQLVKLIGQQYPRYNVKPFNPVNVVRGPLILTGTFTGVNAERKSEGRREAFRICLALADLKTGKLVSKGLAFALPEGVDTTPLPLFADSPAWAPDDATTGYVRTCQGTKPGDAIHPLYIDRIVTAATIAEASEAYAAKRYAQAATLFETALASPGGNQLRVHTGLYLTRMRLGQRSAAAKAFGDIVEQGLDQKRLGVKVLFKPGTAAIWSPPGTTALPYAMWMGEIGRRAAARPSCLDVVGHTSASGAEPVNERISLMRAEMVAGELKRVAPKLTPRLASSGVGSRQALIGNGRDDLSDALDRRVEFLVRGC